MNRQVFFGNFGILLLISAVLLSSLFGMGSLYEWWSRRSGEAPDIRLSRTLLITIKSSGFAAVTAFSLFGDRAAIPSAVMAVTVLLYLLFLSIRKDYRDSNE
jgi:BASS family bile acid:Na+ symporter